MQQCDVQPEFFYEWCCDVRRGLISRFIFAHGSNYE